MFMFARHWPVKLFTTHVVAFRRMIPGAPLWSKAQLAFLPEFLLCDFQQALVDDLVEGQRSVDQTHPNVFVEHHARGGSDPEMLNDPVVQNRQRLAIVGLEENYQAAKTIGFPCSSCKPAPGRTSSAN